MQTYKKKTKSSKKGFKFPTAYTVLLSLMIIIGITTQFVPGVKKSQIQDIVMAPVTGMVGISDNVLEEEVSNAMTNKSVDEALEIINNSDTPKISVWNSGSLKGAIDVSLFVLIIGGFLGVVTKTGALAAGVGTLVKKLKGQELLLIPILMVLFSLGGTSFGMAEESLAFYALITATMIAAGFDALTAVAIILLGCGCGVLGSTVNPFAIGAAVSAAASVGVEINQGTLILMGVVLWGSTLTFSIIYVLRYAKKLKQDKGRSFLSLSEIKNSKEAFANNNEEILELDKKRSLVLCLFTFTFTVMILGVIPWNDFGVTMFDNTTSWLNGAPLGTWWFPELTVWFFLMAVVIGVVYRMSEKDIVDAFISGTSEMIGVALVIGISRGISFMMANSGLDLFILDRASEILSGVSGTMFSVMAYIIYIGLAFLIPSTSGLASVSIPIFAPLAVSLNIEPEIVVTAFSAGSGIVNLITPTSGVVMGGLAISKVEYGTWLKFVGKMLVAIFVVSVIILAGIMFI